MSVDQDFSVASEFHWRCLHFNELSLQDLHQCMAIRQEVFILEQRCFYLDADEYDQNSYHFMLEEKKGVDSKLIAYLRMYYEQNTWHIGRVLVVKDKRGQGLGKQLMLRCHEKLDTLIQKFHGSIELSAQVQVIKFYESLGYRTFGEPYEDAGIPHQSMRLNRYSDPKTALSTVNTIIFDFDGTLIDSAYDYAVSFQRLTKQWDSNLALPDPERIKELMFAGIFPQLEYCLGCLEDEKMQKALEQFRVICLQTPLKYTAPYPGILDLINALKSAGYRLAICTNRSQDLCLQDLEVLGLGAYFEVVVGGDSGWQRKPSPDMLFEIFKTMQVKPDNCVLIGDSKVDIEAAQAAGSLAIAVHWGYTPATAFKSYIGHLEVSKVQELKGLFIREET